ncbi:MAG TPA: HDOD domain-containing protein [Bacteroidota bacterium]|nr:HDOD domain-containing protein [Bacteroidota bacterium]
MVAVASPRDLLRGYVEISSLPMIHLRLDEAINNPRKSMADIAKIIREDPGLTARLLRIVNSAFYNFPSRVETISQAVTIIGTQQLGALALATSVMQMFKGLPEGFVSMDSFWRHCVGCGLAARVLATLRRETNAERHFVAGVLHDIGRLVMFTKAADATREALTRARDAQQLLYEEERETFGFTHAVVGGVLLQTWKLPASLEEVVMFHHNPKAATKYPVETAIVHVADIIAHAMELGGNGEQYVPPLDSEAWDKLGLPASALLTVMEQVERQFVDAVQIIL